MRITPPTWTLCLLLACASTPRASEPAQAPAALDALPSLKVSTYMGNWYQVAYFPNSFQKQCISDTTASYQLQPDGTVMVTNRCRTADGRWDQTTGLARPTGRVDNDQLTPAKLTVSFLPAWLRWLPIARGSYWVIQRADDGRYAVVSEASREYLWVLSRTPSLSAADDTAIRARLVAQGFNLARWVLHPQNASDKPAQP